MELRHFFSVIKARVGYFFLTIKYCIRKIKSMYEDSINVRWKELKPSLSENLQELFYEKHFADVTLVSDDGIQLTAHKVILSACSLVFRNMLVNNPHPHPLLFMRGIKKTHLMSILKFMYCGETQIPQDSIDEFVSICRDLQINDIESSCDLNTPVDDGQALEDNTEKNENEYKEDPPNSMQHTIQKHEISEENVSKEIIEIDLDTEAAKTNLNPHLGQNMPVKSNNENFGVLELHACKECDYKTANISNLRRHKYIKHDNPKHQYKCQHCDFKATLQEYVIRHIKTMHRSKVYDHKMPTPDDLKKQQQKVQHDGVSFSCSECAYTTRWAKDISSHKALNHTNK